MLGKHWLICHPDTPARAVDSVSVEIFVTDGCDALCEYRVHPSKGLMLPEAASPQRRDGLWQTTCCELFLRSPGADRYWEFNFSPSGEWAAYAFSGYRDGMTMLDVDVEPHIECEANEASFVLEADVDFGGLPAGVLRVALSAVIEELDGTKSYWALAHPPGKPDFHHPSCFTLTLPPPEQP